MTGVHAAPPWSLRTEAEQDQRARARSWVGEHLAPHARAWEDARAFPRAVFAAAGRAGLFGAKIPRVYGGSEAGLLADAAITEELAACGSGGVAAALGAHKDLAIWYLYRFGTPEQRSRWLPAALRGETIGALAVTEPDAGSDVAAIRARAEPVAGGGWILEGEKTFITNGAWADVLVVAAATAPGGGHHGLSLFVVEAADPGVTRARVPTMGWRPSQTGSLVFTGVELGPDRLLGGPENLHAGFRLVLENFQWERVAMALAAVRGAQETLRAAVAAGADRAEGDLRAAAVRLEGARALARHALRRHLAGDDAVREICMAKWFCCETALEVAEAAVAAVPAGSARQPLERALRDARLGPIGGGTTEIMLEVIGRKVGL